VKRTALSIIPIAITLFSVLSLMSVCRAENWQLLTTFTGQETTYTIAGPFYVPTDEWRLTWNYELKYDSDFAHFESYIFREGEYTQPVGELVGIGRYDRNGTTYIHEGTKEYYIRIRAAVKNYRIEIEYDSSAPSTPTSTPTTPSPSPSVSPTPTINPTPEPQPQPFPTTLVIVSVITVAVVGIGLLVYFGKRKR